ncbi:MAG: transglutaminase family protein [Bryobacteraceae bacterium]
MRYQVSHITRYSYEAPVSSCHSELRLAPRVTPHQKVWRRSVSVRPKPERIDEREDYFGNIVHRFALFDSHSSLEVHSESIVEVQARPLPLPRSTASWEQVRDAVRAARSGSLFEAIEFTGESPFAVGAVEIELYARDSLAPGRSLLDAVLELNARIHRDFKYKPSSTTIDTTPSEVFKTRRGVCQDFAHLMIAMLRPVGIPVRYVSGYLRSGASYTGAEASHAWVSVFVPEAGWVDLDPTNNVVPEQGHVTVAWGRDYGDVTPVKGVTLGGGEQKIDVEVRVIPATS